MSSPPPAEAPDLRGAAEVEADAARRAAERETHANRPDQFNPLGSVGWENNPIDASTGRPIKKDKNGHWQFADSGPVDQPPRPSNLVRNPRYGDPSAPRGQEEWVHNGVDNEQTRAEWDAWQNWHDNINSSDGGNSAYGSRIDPVDRWTQTTTLTPEAQAILDAQLAAARQQQDYRAAQVQDWSDNPVDWGGIGGDNLEGTINRGDLGQFGQQSANMGAQDWRQFGTTNAQISGDDWRQFGTTDTQISGDDWRQFGTTDQTIGANDWQQQGNTEQTIGADDWRQFGTTDTTINSGDWDARFGGQDQSGGFGDHGMEGSDWNQISYTPDAIRRQAESETMNFMNSQLDPQWDTKQSDLETKLYNQGLQPGDAAWDNAMESQKNSRSSAYAGARNQALADSRAEASMLWGQEMQRSEQKNMQTQADVDNIYRARQSNISNYQGQRATDMQGYLAYQDTAFNQDYQQRQQQLDANLNYGNSAFQQDFDARGQRLNAQLGFGREAFGQDLQSRQQQLDANLAYGREGFGQDLASRQQQLDANLAYGREGYNQDYQSRQQQLDSNRLYSAQAFDQDYRSRQANINNYLNFGNAEFGQNLSAQELELRRRQAEEAAAQGRYGLVNPDSTIGNINDNFT